MPRRSGRSSSRSWKRTQRRNNVYKQNQSNVRHRQARQMNKAKNKKYRMPNSSGALSSSFTLPLLISTYFLLAGASQKKQTVVHHHHDNGDTNVQHVVEEEEVEEIPQLPETDSCFNQYKSMMDCLGTENSECKSVIDLMEQCAKFNTPEV